MHTLLDCSAQTEYPACRITPIRRTDLRRWIRTSTWRWIAICYCYRRYLSNSYIRKELLPGLPRKTDGLLTFEHGEVELFVQVHSYNHLRERKFALCCLVYCFGHCLLFEVKLFALHCSQVFMSSYIWYSMSPPVQRRCITVLQVYAARPGRLFV